MLTNDQKQHILDVLIRIKTSGYLFNSSGICGNVTSGVSAQTADEFYSYFQKICVTWPEFSGSLLYPVPSPDPAIPANEYYFVNEHKWCPPWEATEAQINYCNSRWRLLDYMIQFIYDDLAGKYRENV